MGGIVGGVFGGVSALFGGPGYSYAPASGYGGPFAAPFNAAGAVAAAPFQVVSGAMGGTSPSEPLLAASGYTSGCKAPSGIVGSHAEDGQETPEKWKRWRIGNPGCNFGVSRAVQPHPILDPRSRVQVDRVIRGRRLVHEGIGGGRSGSDDAPANRNCM